MLASLTIRNVVLIDKLELDFRSGLSVLTGETGAGKSILLDSLGLVLGKRAETSLIRQGEDKLSVIAVFDREGANQPLQKLLAENDLDGGDELIIKRSLSRDGKGKIFCNDQPISARLLKDIGRTLVEIHGQFDNQGLLNPANHRDILDAYGHNPALTEQVSAAWQAYRAAAKARSAAETDISRAKLEEENLRHWVKELEAVNPRQGEEAELTQRRSEMMHAEKIIESLSYAYAALTEGCDVSSALRKAQSAVDKANRHVDGRYDEIYAALDRALAEVNEAAEQIEAASSNIALNAQEQESIDNRLFALKDLARKHGVAVDELERIWQDFKRRLNAIELGEDGLETLRRQETECRLAYLESANLLHRHRLQTAAELDAKVMSELPPLKMDKARFVTVISALPETGWSERGIDDICFTVSTNPNSPQGPLNKIASGGELARFMLALKVNLAAGSDVSAMVFDEVDSGIGGATAQAVGERLARLGRQVQVLVVTHSPQVAARGNCHYKVEKNTAENITTTSVRELSAAERREEIARMLAGEVITDEARAAASVLLSA